MEKSPWYGSDRVVGNSFVADNYQMDLAPEPGKRKGHDDGDDDDDGGDESPDLSSIDFDSDDFDWDDGLDNLGI